MKNAELLENNAYTRYDYTEEQAGRDFWLTRNGHGTGFWDRKQLAGELGGKLTEACSAWRGVDLYAGDDGKLYLM